MTATDELRRMLDERGVEWSDSSDENVLHTTWNAMRCWFTEYPDGWTGWGTAMSGSPEQAIEATLGRGTCKPVDGYDDDGEEIGTVCSECGSPWPIYYVVRYCPVCGCKVVDDASVD